MQTIIKSERATQNRVIRLFQTELHYQYLGDWTDRPNNSNVETALLTQNLAKRGYSAILIQKAIGQLQKKTGNLTNGLYDANKGVYSLLRYGCAVSESVGKPNETVHFIDWAQPENNDFAIAEEVTIQGKHDKRPDIVLYVNGIALGVLELKKSTKEIGEGIRQNLTNQAPEFIEAFFTTIQYCFAGNDSEGLRYGTIGTPSKYYLTWKEDEADNTRLKLDKYLLKMCEKARFLEVLYDFVLFDGGVKKLPRHHQYFGIKAVQTNLKPATTATLLPAEEERQGGIIWHTQGSGKSITMVLLAKWLLENKPNARIAVITDRDELDKQIKGVFLDAGETVVLARSGKELQHLLSKPEHRLICSLVHKFGAKARGVSDFDAFLKTITTTQVPLAGDFFVFVDECHRTQSGKLHQVMKAMLPKAVFIGFTGTPLLKSDKQTTLEVFGKYLHTYKFDEAVADGVVLDLVYEARDIEQRISSQERIDEWFEAKTKRLNDFQRTALKKQWGTMQKVLSSRSRMEQVVTDIVFDFGTRPRLNDGKGNAILITHSIRDACKYYEAFQKTIFKGKCGLITSYNPSHRDIVNEETGENSETDKQFIYNIYTELLKTQTTEKYEEEAKNKFLKEPANMKLLIVVSKLLTGFDAPTCSYLYLDKEMKDHGLFQAICRVNRLDGDTKELGYIVDYKKLFKNVQGAMSVYTEELAYDDFDDEDCDILLETRLQKGRKRLDDALEMLETLCEAVDMPQTDLEYRNYFCGNTEIPTDLAANAYKREAFYKAVTAFIRAYANIADELDAAGYTPEEMATLSKALKNYTDLREMIKNASGEKLDIKDYEADMRHLIDNYIQADAAQKVSAFESLTLLEIIVKVGIEKALEDLPEGNKRNKAGVSETIENNVRSKIVKDHLTDPVFYERMSTLLQELVRLRKADAISYAEYLLQIAELVRNVEIGDTEDVPTAINTPAKRALYHYLDDNEDLAMVCNDAVLYAKKADWKGNEQKEREIQQALFEKLNDVAQVNAVFEIIKNQKEYL
jgi:type I restriction enzyme, R subunit